jgi:predicted  nucleic acid-binding Zn-ribbon protein
MTDVPNFEQHRLNSFEDKLQSVQADLTGLRRSHLDLRTEMGHRFNALDARFDTVEARMETMIEEMRRFFSKYEDIDVEQQT